MSETYLAAMVAAVRAAARICRTVQGELVQGDTVNKDDRSPVTIADLAGQAVVAHALELAVPEIPLVGEEDSSVLAGEERRAVREAVLGRVRTEWTDAGEPALMAAIDRGSNPGGGPERFFTLDPIDGTKGFLRGEQYAVALGMIEHGREQIGVLGCPNLPQADGSRGMLLVAIRGSGAWRLPLDGDGILGDPIAVSPQTDVRQIRFCESVEKAHSHRGVSARVAEVLGVEAEPVRMDSQCKYAILAEGRAELYLRIPRDVNRSENIWDHAAGGLIVEEAGGRVTDLDGAALDFSKGRTLTANRGIVASNRKMHDAVLEALRTAEAG